MILRFSICAPCILLLIDNERGLEREWLKRLAFAPEEREPSQYRNDRNTGPPLYLKATPAAGGEGEVGGGVGVVVVVCLCV